MSFCPFSINYGVDPRDQATPQWKNNPVVIVWEYFLKYRNASYFDRDNEANELYHATCLLDDDEFKAFCGKLQSQKYNELADSFIQKRAIRKIALEKLSPKEKAKESKASE